MNISGIVVKAAPENREAVIEALKTSGLCEVHLHDEQCTIIVTVEGEDTGEEVKKMREIMNIPHVLCADLAYSYNEDETEGSLFRLERVRDAVPDALKSLPADL
jgi:nitrate reductase NapAB chaperone NapD